MADKFAKINNTNTQIFAIIKKLEIQFGESFNILKKIKKIIKTVGNGLNQFNIIIIKYFNGKHGKNRQNK